MPEAYFSLPPQNVEAVFLALDYGTKRTGVAVGQSITGTATPLPTLLNKPAEHPDVWFDLETLYNQWKPYGFVVGIPYNVDGSPGVITPMAKDFAQRLAAHFPGKPIFPADERLTTIAARQALFEKEGYKGLKQKEIQIDSIAAQVIFESWWREHGYTTQPV